MNITTPVERQAKGAVPTCIPRAIFQPSARKTNEIYNTARERLRGCLMRQPRSRSHAVLRRHVKPTEGTVPGAVATGRPFSRSLPLPVPYRHVKPRKNRGNY